MLAKDDDVLLINCIEVSYHLGSSVRKRKVDGGGDQEKVMLCRVNYKEMEVKKQTNYISKWINLIWLFHAVLNLLHCTQLGLNC